MNYKQTKMNSLITKKNLNKKNKNKINKKNINEI